MPRDVAGSPSLGRPEQEEGIPASEGSELRRIALKLAAENGDPRPSSIGAVGTGRLRALALVDSGVFVRGADEASHLIVMTGRFSSDRGESPRGSEAPAGEVLWLLVTAEGHVVEDWGMLPHLPDLSPLGPVLDLTTAD